MYGFKRLCVCSINEVRAKDGSGSCAVRVAPIIISPTPKKYHPKKGRNPPDFIIFTYTWSAASLRLRRAPSYALHTHLTYARLRHSPAATRRWCSTSMSANVNSGGTSSSCTSNAVVSRTSGRLLAASKTRVERMLSGRCVAVDEGSRTSEGG